MPVSSFDVISDLLAGCALQCVDCLIRSFSWFAISDDMSVSQYPVSIETRGRLII